MKRTKEWVEQRELEKKVKKKNTHESKEKNNELSFYLVSMGIIR